MNDLDDGMLEVGREVTRGTKESEDSGHSLGMLEGEVGV